MDQIVKLMFFFLFFFLVAVTLRSVDVWASNDVACLNS